MKKIIVSIISVIVLFPHIAAGELNTGFYLSLGQLHYSIKGFSEGQEPAVTGKPSDLFLEVTLSYKNTLELNLLYNRATGEFESGPDRLTYDMDGFGIEAGKIINIHLFKKNDFDVSADVAAGGYYLFFPFKNISIKKPGEVYRSGEAGLYYQAGFYWSIRLKYLVSGKLSLNLGFKSLLPVRSNEFISLEEEDILIFKSFFYAGIAF